MSYSFSARGATKAEVMEKVTAEFDKVVAAQPIHSADRTQAEVAAGAFLDIVPEAEGKDFYLSVNGSVSWTHEPKPETITAASVSVSAYLVNKE